MNSLFSRLSRGPGRRRLLGFTLTELMVAVGVAVLGGAIAYPLFISDLNLYAKNFSLNKSNNSLRYSLLKLKQDIDMSIEPPLLMSYRVSGTTGILKPLTSSTVSSQAIMMWVNLGPAYDLQPTNTSGTDTSVTTTGIITLTRHIAAPGDAFASSPVPQIGDRLVIMSPAPYSTGMPENVVMDGVSIQKPGRRITYVNGLTSGTVPDNGSATVTVKLDLTNTPLPTGITGYKSVYIVREVAYVATTLTDASGNAIESDLLNYPSTNNMTNAKTLIRDLDPNPQEIDATTGVIIQPFNYYTGRANLSPLSINLPIRALDYANAVASRYVATGQINVSSEFNLFLRSNPQMGIKVRLD